MACRLNSWPFDYWLLGDEKTQFERQFSWTNCNDIGAVWSASGGDDGLPRVVGVVISTPSGGRRHWRGGGSDGCTIWLSAEQLCDARGGEYLT